MTVLEVDDINQLGPEMPKWNLLINSKSKRHVGIKNLKKNYTCFLAKNCPEWLLKKVFSRKPAKVFRLPYKSTSFGQIYGKDYGITILSVL